MPRWNPNLILDRKLPHFRQRDHLEQPNGLLRSVALNRNSGGSVDDIGDAGCGHSRWPKKAGSIVGEGGSIRVTNTLYFTIRGGRQTRVHIKVWKVAQYVDFVMNGSHPSKRTEVPHPAS